MLPLLAALAAAQDLPLPPSDPAPPSSDLPLPAAEPPLRDAAWIYGYEAGMNTARVGIALGGAGTAGAGAGVVLFVGGLLVGSEGVAVLGGITLVGSVVAVQIGSPLMAGGSLRAARALEDAGYTVARWPGHVAWGLWGGSIALSLAAPFAATTDAEAGTALSTLGGVAFLGSYALAGTQMAMNGAAYRGAPPMVYVGPMPMDGGAGATLALRF